MSRLDMEILEFSKPNRARLNMEVQPHSYSLGEDFLPGGSIWSSGNEPCGNVWLHGQMWVACTAGPAPCANMDMFEP